jgi:hypothetical protein
MNLLDRYPVFLATVLAGVLYGLGQLAARELGLDPVVGFVLAGLAIVVAWQISQ